MSSLLEFLGDIASECITFDRGRLDSRDLPSAYGLARLYGVEFANLQLDLSDQALNAIVRPH